MSAYNPAYNPAGYLTDIYGRPVLENPYALFYPGPPTDQYVPHHWTPDHNQAFYVPSISQGISLGWRHPSAFSANGNNPHMYSRGYSAAPPNPTYFPPVHYYAYPVPAAAPTTPGPMDNYSPPQMPFSAQAAPSPRQRRVEAYTQQCDEVLRFLRLSPTEFTRCTHTLLTNLGYPNTSVTLEVWAIDSSTSMSAICKGTSWRLHKAPWALTITYGMSSTHWSKKSTPAQTPAPLKTL
ncbi:hypothetical protein C0989_007094 [Termitomyces sp. Mn162]|nr:hypothetical protein C0989_007094 [Termitomyces sp. Mn162]